MGATSNSRDSVFSFEPLPSNHNANTQAIVAETRVIPSTGDRGGAELWSAPDPSDLESVVPLVESPLSHARTVHRAVLKLMALERDLLPMISFPEYNFE